MSDDDGDDGKQGDLFNKPSAFARHTDPETSHDAARSFEGVVAEAELLVLRVTVQRNELGATWDEVDDALGGALAKSSISPRWRPLTDKGLIECRCDEHGKPVKRVGVSGRSQLVHYATPMGRAVVTLSSS